MEKGIQNTINSRFAHSIIMKRVNPYDAQRQAALKKRKTTQAQALAGQAFSFPRALVRAPPRVYMQGAKGEKKVVDTTTGTGSVNFLNTTPTITLINPVQVGNNYYNRLGNKIQPHSIHVIGNINNLITAVQQWVRILVILDKTPSGNTAPPLTTILASHTQTGTSINAVNSLVNMDYRDRFLLLRDYKMQLPSVTNTAGVLTNLGFYDQAKDFTIDFYIRLRRYGEMQFTGTANPITTAQIQSNAIYLVALSSEDNQWQLSFRARFCYYDV